MSARAVVAAGEAFVGMGLTLHDPGVALDEISSMTGNVEPVVLRVHASGGDRDDREDLAGDWLCADGARPRRVPQPAWDYDADARAFCRSRPWLEAWEQCQDARWMLRAAGSAGVDVRALVMASCACARLIVDRVPAGDARPIRAIEAAEAWAAGNGTEFAASHAGAYATEAWSEAQEAARLGSRASVSAALAPYDAAAAAAYSVYHVELDRKRYAPDAAERAMYAARRPADRRHLLSAMAQAVRRVVSTEDVLRAAVRRGG